MAFTNTVLVSTDWTSIDSLTTDLTFDYTENITSAY